MSKAVLIGNRPERPNGCLRVSSREQRHRRITGRLWPLMLMMATGFTATAAAQQYFEVDCTGATPGDYATISSALAAAGNSAQTVVPQITYVVAVAGPCNARVLLGLESSGRCA